MFGGELGEGLTRLGALKKANFKFVKVSKKFHVTYLGLLSCLVFFDLKNAVKTASWRGGIIYITPIN